MTDDVSLQLNSWLVQIGLATVGQTGDMGANLSTARDFLELHERLSEDMKVNLIAVVSARATLCCVCIIIQLGHYYYCLLYTSPSPRD